MNKYQEDLNIIFQFYKEANIEGKFLLRSAIDELQELADRETPIKPTFYKPLKTFNGSDIEQPFYIIKCGKCEYWLEPSDKFCSNCGAEIDWSKDES